MQVLEASSCQLSNFEVHEALAHWREARRCEQILPSESVFEFEKGLLRSVLLPEKFTRRQDVHNFLTALDVACKAYRTPAGDELYLTPAEKIQILNTKPCDRLSLELLVEGLATEERIAHDTEDEFKDGVIDL
eukprot:gene15698-23969_t